MDPILLAGSAVDGLPVVGNGLLRTPAARVRLFGVHFQGWDCWVIRLSAGVAVTKYNHVGGRGGGKEGYGVPGWWGLESMRQKHRGPPRQGGVWLGRPGALRARRLWWRSQFP